MTEITETVEDSIETGEEDLSAVDALITVAVSALVGAVAAVGVPRLYRRIRNRKTVDQNAIETTSREV
jgi:hypothetical protein